MLQQGKGKKESQNQPFVRMNSPQVVETVGCEKYNSDEGGEKTGS